MTINEICNKLIDIVSQEQSATDDIQDAENEIERLKQFIVERKSDLVDLEKEKIETVQTFNSMVDEKIKETNQDDLI